MARAPRKRKTKTVSTQTKNVSTQINKSGEHSQNDDFPQDTDKSADELDNEQIVIQTLRNILLDSNSASAARASAARTLAEINGQVGRHSAPTTTDETPLSELSIDQLEAELSKLETSKDAAK